MRPTPSDPPDWNLAAASLAKVLDELDGAVIGGVAVSLRSIPRFTKDIDAVCWQGKRSYREILDILTKGGLRPRSADPIKFARQNRVFPMIHEGSGIGIDISLGATPFERETIDRADPIELSGAMVRVATVEDLVVLKLIAGRAIDVADIEGLLQTNPDLDRKRIRKHVREFAKELGAPGIVRTMNRLLGKN